jgi:4-amino-4-deoxy-L-arabinose transferase-like glycosyltransferase
VLTLATIYTLLNAWKPLHIDDAAYYLYAAQISEHPLDPYGFELLWYDVPEPADTILAPPVLPYWWALAIRLFGENYWLWKLWLWPFSFLFVLSFWELCRRFARGLETRLVVLTVLSPLFLPSLNYMLDVPAVALGLAALCLFLRSCDGNAAGWAALAGVVAGIAMQTKYTAFVMPAVMMLYALTQGKCRLRAVLAGFVALCFFAGWEVFTRWRYGHSHFLFQLAEQTDGLWDKYALAYPLLPILGAVSPALLLLGCVGWGASGRVLRILVGWLLAALVLVAVTPQAYAQLHWRFGDYVEVITPEDVLFSTLGTMLAMLVLLTAARLCRGKKAAGGLWARFRTRSLATAPGPRHRLDWFLALWLILELVAYFPLTPFPAARRVMGLLLAATLIVGRWTSLTCRSRPRRRLVTAVVTFGVLLGLGFAGLDFREAVAERQAAEGATALARAHQAGTIWYLGHWGFQHYAERAGLKPVVANESRLHKGDWVLVPDEHVYRQRAAFRRRDMELIATYRVEDVIPFRTVRNFYGGRAPLAHREGPRALVRVYRVRADFTPRQGR